MQVIDETVARVREKLIRWRKFTRTTLTDEKKPSAGTQRSVGSQWERYLEHEVKDKDTAGDAEADQSPGVGDLTVRKEPKSVTFAPPDA